MVKLIEAENISMAWKKGCECIVNHGSQTKTKIKFHNLILDIKNLDIDERIDKIFRRYMDSGIFQRTLDIVSSEKSFGDHPSYRRRLKGLEKFKIDQITKVISRLQEQPHSTKLTLCIYTPEDFDRKHIPCILCAELRVEKRQLYLTAFVRSQDFGNKSYADYIGLSRILQEIAEKSGIQPGGMIIHTITASIDNRDMGRIKTILKLFSE